MAHTLLAGLVPLRNAATFPTAMGHSPPAAELCAALAEWAEDPASEVGQGSRSGIVAATVVPPPGGLSTRSSPFIAATRS